MNFLKRKTSWSNAELGLIKVCLASIWISAGAYFHEYLEKYIPLYLTVFIITAAWCGYLWIKKIKN